MTILLGIIIVILIVICVIMSGFALINGSLSRRSVCYAIMVLGISAYSIIGYLWTAGSDELVESWAYVLSSVVIFFCMLNAMYWAFLSLMPLKLRTFLMLALIGAIPGILYVIISVMRPDMQLAILIEDGVRSIVWGDNMILLLLQYVNTIAYAGIAIYFGVSNVKQTQGKVRSHARLAVIALVIAFVLGIIIDMLNDVIPYGHSLVHVLMFLLPLCAYKAFTDDVADDDA